MSEGSYLYRLGDRRLDEETTNLNIKRNAQKRNHFEIRYRELSILENKSKYL